MKSSKIDTFLSFLVVLTVLIVLASIWGGPGNLFKALLSGCIGLGLLYFIQSRLQWQARKNQETHELQKLYIDFIENIVQLREEDKDTRLLIDTAIAKFRIIADDEVMDAMDELYSCSEDDFDQCFSELIDTMREEVKTQDFLRSNLFTDIKASLNQRDTHTPQ